MDPTVRARLMSLPKHKGAFLYGPPGVGKSWAAAALARWRILRGQTVRRVVCDDLFRAVRETYSRGYTGPSEGCIIESLRRPDVLVIEDMGTGVSRNAQESDFNVRILLAILDNRIENAKVTFVTSNKSPVELGRSYDARIEDRLYQGCEVMPMKGRSLRRLQKGRS